MSEWCVKCSASQTNVILIYVDSLCSKFIHAWLLIYITCYIKFTEVMTWKRGTCTRKKNQVGWLVNFISLPFQQIHGKYILLGKLNFNLLGWQKYFRLFSIGIAIIKIIIKSYFTQFYFWPSNTMYKTMAILSLAPWICYFSWALPHMYHPFHFPKSLVASTTHHD